MASAKFYLGRVHKIGRVTHQSILDAITSPKDIVEREYQYSFVDAHVERGETGVRYIYAKMVKFAAQGLVGAVDTEKHVTIEEPMKNKTDADVPFVYIPEYEGIAYHRVWNRLTPDQFVARFDKLISEKLDGVLARAEIEPIVNVEVFSSRIGEFKSFGDIQASVTPPNPLFGPAWESLKNHLETRNLRRLQISEEAKAGSTIQSGLKKLLDLMGSKATPQEIRTAISSTSIADQAVLMAAAGYGDATVKGTDMDDRPKTISTRDDQMSLDFAQLPSKEELYERTYAALKKINSDQQLGHS